MATLAGLVADTYNLLYGVAQMERPAEDTLTGAINDAVTSLTPTTTTLWKRDDYAEFADGEVVVFAADSAGATVVRRAQRSTTAASHSDGALMYKNPLFLRSQIEDFVTEVVNNDLWEDVWSWHQDTLTYTQGDTTYDLDQYVEDVVKVYQYDLDSDNRLHPLPRTWWDVEKQVAAAVSTNKNLLRLRRVHDTTATVYYTAKRRPNAADLSNLSDECASLVKWAAAGKALAGLRSAPMRYDPAHQTRDQSEGGPFRDYRGLMGEFLRGKTQLNRTLRREVPEERIFVRRQRRRSW